MKTKHKIFKQILIVALLFIGNHINGQVKETVDVPLSEPGKDGKLIVNIIDGSISVTGYDGDTVEVVARVKSGGKSKSRSPKNEREGMKRVEGNGLEFTVEEVNNTVYVKYSPGRTVIDFEIKVPRHFSVDLKTINKGDILVDGINGTHEASNTNGKITMTNVGGSVVADALNKNITVSFKTIFANANMMFTSLNGDVDITFPNDFRANISARSDFGNVYTDFEIDVAKTSSKLKTSEKSGVYKVKREKGIYGSINGGGADITFKTLNGDILIRSH